MMPKVYDRERGESMKKDSGLLSIIGKPFSGVELINPVPGDFYDAHNGQTYQCIASAGEPYCAVMENVTSGWRFVAHRIYQFPDGYIEWGCSTSGRFAR